MILALMLLSQDPFFGLEEDRKAFQPYRQCVLAEAGKRYRTGNSLKVIFEQAKKSCPHEEAAAAADIALNAAKRTIDAAARDNGEPGQPEFRFQIFQDELLYEITDDFVPRAK